MVSIGPIARGSHVSHFDSLPLAAESLVSVSMELYANGCAEDAISMLDMALSAIKCPSDKTGMDVPNQMQMGCKRLLSGEKIALKKKSDEKIHPDLYQEDECDVGPRILLTPARPTSQDAKDCALLEAAILFNKGLVCHSMCRYMEAKQHYQAVLFALRKMFASPVQMTSNLLMELGMRAENNMGFINYCEGNETDSVANFEASLFFARHLCSVTNDYQLEYANVLSNLSRVSWMRGDVSDNLYKNLQEVLQIRSSLLPWDHPDVAASHFNLAVAEYARQRNNHATPHFLKYVQLCASSRADLGGDKLDPIPGLVYLMLIRNEDKDDNMSQELVRSLRTLQDKRQDQGPKSSEVASVLNYIGTLLFHQGDCENALLFFQEELRLEDALPEIDGDISTSVTCNNIGRILQEMGKFNEAISYYQRALKVEYGDISQLSLTKGSKTCTLRSKGQADATSSSSNLYSTVWYNLGLIHDKLGSYDDAIFAFEMSLDLRRSMLGPDHPDIACLLYNIGVLRMERKQLAEASLCFREALRVHRNGAAGQLNDRHVVKTLEKLSSLHKAKGNIKGALEAAKEVLAIQEVSPDYDNLTRLRDVGITLRSIAELHHAIGDLDASVETAIASALKLKCLLEQKESTASDQYSQIVNLEQLASSLLLLGSLYHEICDPVSANIVLQEASRMLVEGSATLPSHSLVGLQEVTGMLATSHCAPQA